MNAATHHGSESCQGFECPLGDSREKADHRFDEIVGKKLFPTQVSFVTHVSAPFVISRSISFGQYVLRYEFG